MVTFLHIEGAAGQSAREVLCLIFDVFGPTAPCMRSAAGGQLHMHGWSWRAWAERSMRSAGAAPFAAVRGRLLDAPRCRWAWRACWAEWSVRAYSPCTCSAHGQLAFAREANSAGPAPHPQKRAACDGLPRCSTCHGACPHPPPCAGCPLCSSWWRRSWPWQSRPWRSRPRKHGQWSRPRTLGKAAPSWLPGGWRRGCGWRGLRRWGCGRGRHGWSQWGRSGLHGACRSCGQRRRSRACGCGRCWIQPRRSWGCCCGRRGASCRGCRGRGRHSRADGCAVGRSSCDCSCCGSCPEGLSPR